MKRRRIAFLVAPLWVPFATVIIANFSIFPYPQQGAWVIISGVIAAVFAYVGTLLLGVPAFRFLVSRNWTALWIAPALGFSIGILMWVLFLVLIPLFLGEGVEGIREELGSAANNLLAQAVGLLVTGGLGALVGVTLWLIARPDRADT